MCVYVHTHACRGHRSVSGIFLNDFYILLRQGLSLNLELNRSAREADQQAPGIVLSLLSFGPSAGVSCAALLPAGDPNSGPHA